MKVKKYLLFQNDISFNDYIPKFITQLLHADNPFRSNNGHLLRGIVQLGRLLIQNTDIKDCMSGQDVLHT
jgi:hypothetical protein